MTIDCTDDEGHYYSLTLTPSHMIVTEHGGVIPASMVIQGDRIRTGDGTVAVVTRITKNVKKQGMYAPFTESGYLIVDGLVVSNYVALLLLDESSYNSWFLWNHHHQWLSHTLTLPRRWYCHYYDCTNETYTAEGIATWARPLLSVAQQGIVVTNHHHPMIRTMGFMGIVVVASLIHVIYHYYYYSLLLFLLTTIFVTAWLLVLRKKHKSTQLE
mmetsp:Transcript_21566/g.32641  ORF Transcript_21566/g.32641 Transcript_21566/m.32641 type:complete len:214 (-) Transcript_21566:69-710(-)